jgi:hypothetical protein
MQNHITYALSLLHRSGVTNPFPGFSAYVFHIISEKCFPLSTAFVQNIFENKTLEN